MVVPVLGDRLAAAAAAEEKTLDAHGAAELYTGS